MNDSKVIVALDEAQSTPIVPVAHLLKSLSETHCQAFLPASVLPPQFNVMLRRASSLRASARTWSQWECPA
ncbi:MAG TPA: hypothetical protein VMR43_09320 [Variovorax sp.]|nr:hypothetical protein [Variovorax sp.]